MYSFNELQGIFEQELRSMKWPREPRLLYEPIAYSLEEGGKRIRPVALLMACSAFRGGIDAAKPAAMAIEVFHNFTLLHDDIMDRSDMRRGKPAVHTRWNDNTDFPDRKSLCPFICIIRHRRRQRCLFLIFPH